MCMGVGPMAPASPALLPAFAYEREPGAASRPLPRAWRRRQPEQTALYAVVQEHLETFLQQARDADPAGSGLPRFIEGELRRYLDCGLLSRGFARLRCASCGDERLVALSSKGRMCPSCWARRAADTASDLPNRMGRLLPDVPYRQWVLTFPWALRFRLACDRALLSRMLRVFLRTLFAWQRRRGRALAVAGTTCAQTGSVTDPGRAGPHRAAQGHRDGTGGAAPRPLGPAAAARRAAPRTLREPGALSRRLRQSVPAPRAAATPGGLATAGPCVCAHRRHPGGATAERTGSRQWGRGPVSGGARPGAAAHDAVGGDTACPTGLRHARWGERSRSEVGRSRRGARRPDPGSGNPTPRLSPPWHRCPAPKTPLVGGAAPPDARRGRAHLRAVRDAHGRPRLPDRPQGHQADPRAPWTADSTSLTGEAPSGRTPGRRPPRLAGRPCLQPPAPPRDRRARRS